VFIDRFEELCMEAGISPTSLVIKLGISKGSYSNWKKGGTPSYPTQKKIADYFGMSISDLTAENKAKKEAPRTKRPKGLTEDEIKMLEVYRQVPGEYKAVAIDMIEAALKKK